MSGAIVLSPGFDIFDARAKKEYGYGEFKNVVSSLDFERILLPPLVPSGTRCQADRPPHPKKVASSIVGSRDEKVGNPYCSSVCCMYAMKQAIIAGEHTAGSQPSIFFMDVRAFGKEFEDYRSPGPRRRYHIKIPRNQGRVSGGETPRPRTYSCATALVRKWPIPEVVQSGRAVGRIRAAGGSKEIAEPEARVKLNPYGFCRPMCTPRWRPPRREYSSAAHSLRPKDIPTTVAEGILWSSFEGRAPWWPRTVSA